MNDPVPANAADLLIPSLRKKKERYKNLPPGREKDALLADIKVLIIFSLTETISA